MTASSDLVERAMRTKPAPGRPYKSNAVVPINPDGHDLAKRITELESDKAVLVEALSGIEATALRGDGPYARARYADTILALGKCARAALAKHGGDNDSIK